MTNLLENLSNRLETRWVTPSYGGLVLGGIALCFFGAATNTMAGWLYAISGSLFALLVLGAVLPARSLARLQVSRLPIAPVSTGDRLALELDVNNPTAKAKSLLQISDRLPPSLAASELAAIEVLPPRRTHRILYTPIATRRGIYRWDEVVLRTATPLGLFWCRRSRSVPAKAIVYPTVLPLKRCPLIDTLGREESLQQLSDRRYHSAQEGITRTLRPYRSGDPTRLIHWRRSARLGEFQVRELEVVTGGQEVLIALDTAAFWDAEDFEQGVIAAASLYFYASRCQMSVKLGTARTGLLQGDRVVLEALAATQSGETPTASDLPERPLLWLTPNRDRLNALPSGSRYLLFPAPTDSAQGIASFPGFVINSEQPLADQLQKSV
ncbi:MAG: DUF58 domain-containing protein [Cyanobacteriota bacterium]|nr:DUF58 domain-containing protein [Cyanobacteriota bacterium]